MTSATPAPGSLPLANAKHEAVLQAWIADAARVWWKAYQSVYPKASQHAAETAASRLLKSAEFCARKDFLLGTIAERVVSSKVMELEEVLEELSKLGRSDIRNCLVAGDDTGEVIASLRSMKPEHSAAIQELIVETYMEGAGDDAREVKRVKLKLHSKHAALAELRAHHEPQKHEHRGEPLDELEIARRIAFALELGARAKARREARAKPTKAQKDPT